MFHRVVGGRPARALVRRASLVALALSLTLSSTAASADPTPDHVAGARAAATEGNKAFSENRFQDALDLFKRAESLLHAPTHLLMIARSHAALGHLVAARESYRALVHETLAPTAHQAFRDAQAAAKKELEALEPRVPTLLVKLSDPSAKDVVVTMDGEPLPAALVGIARPVDPGEHKVSARGETTAADEQTITVLEGGKMELVLRLHPAPKLTPDQGPKNDATTMPPTAEPADPTLSYVGYSALGIGGAGVIVGSVFLGLGFATRSDADAAYERCGSEACVEGSAGQKETDDFDDDANLQQTVGVVALSVGGAAAVTGLVLVLIAPSDEAAADASAPEVSVRPRVGPTWLGVSGTFQ
jgi:hypothetical protein